MAMRVLDELEMGRRAKPRTRWIKVDLPTPAEPMTAIVYESIGETVCDCRRKSLFSAGVEFQDKCLTIARPAG